MVCASSDAPMRRYAHTPMRRVLTARPRRRAGCPRRPAGHCRLRMPRRSPASESDCRLPSRVVTAPVRMCLPRHIRPAECQGACARHSSRPDRRHVGSARTTPATTNVGPAFLRASISAGPALRPASARNAARPQRLEEPQRCARDPAKPWIHRPQIPNGETTEQHAHRCAQTKLEAAERRRRETDESAEGDDRPTSIRPVADVGYPQSRSRQRRARRSRRRAGDRQNISRVRQQVAEVKGSSRPARRNLRR